MLRFIVPAILPFLLLSCAPKSTPAKAMEIAYRYTQMEWQPDSRHVRHGNDSRGIRVDTPDTTLMHHGERGGWWVPGRAAKGMPYKWGGFD
ncbi:MAG: hypothetical protein EOP87_02220, partial [Verrucomicrobiaceae bacterium]